MTREAIGWLFVAATFYGLGIATVPLFRRLERWAAGQVRQYEYEERFDAAYDEWHRRKAALSRCGPRVLRP